MIPTPTYEEFAARLDVPADDTNQRKFYQELLQNCRSAKDWGDYAFAILDECDKNGFRGYPWCEAYAVASANF